MPIPRPKSDEKKSAFIARFMANDAMREEFPDPSQRRAVAESAWTKGQKRRQLRKDVYSFAHSALCACCKQDVPEVQAVIRILQQPLEVWWREIMGQATREAVRRLRELEDELPTPSVDGLVRAEDRSGTEELLVLAFLASLRAGARTLLTTRLETLVVRSTETLLETGAASLQLPAVDLSREPLFRAAAREDLRNMLAGRIETRQKELEEHAREFLRSARARQPARPGDIRPDPPPPFRSRNLQEWLARTSSLAGMQTSQWLPEAVDQWAYRWYVIGQAKSALQAGFRGLAAVAVRDERTTPFCNWVDGRIISLQRIENQIQRHVEAALRGDVDAMFRNWPLLPNSIIRGKSRDFKKGFARVGLPPYHNLCRTTVRPVRL